MRQLKRQAFTLAAAVMLPLLLLGGLLLSEAVNAQRNELDHLSRSRAAEISRMVEGRLSTEVKLIEALASASVMESEDIPGAYARSLELQAIAGSWKAVRLSDLDSGLELFQTGRAYGAPGTIRPSILTAARGLGFGQVVIGDLEQTPDGGYVIPVHVRVKTPRRLGYMLTVDLDPKAIHRLVASQYPKSGVGAVVDREGRFISRSLAYPERLGQMSSVYVRNAIAKGGTGVYRGKTLEGFSNYTAYSTSPVSGWSAHVAASSSPYDVARRWSIAIWIVGIAGCLVFSGLLIYLALREIAASRREDERVRQSQKMEAIGHLTGGIAHDFNNLLTVIVGGLDLVLRRMEPVDKNRRYIEGALDAAQRGAKLTSRLLAFSRTRQLRLEPVDIEATIESIADLLSHSLGPDITVRAAIAPDARWVMTDANQLELALLNLATNARDAMPGGGSITIATRLSDAKSAKGPVELTVTDTGAGMSPQILAHALDPFFTTKAVDKGTGLGLAQVYALARESHGELRLESTPGKGTRVLLSLPSTDARPGVFVEEAATAIEAAPGVEGKRILVLDDDVSVRGVLVENLRARGYAVFEASTGEDALRVLGQIDPDLFILDYIMPGLNGAEVARQVRAVRPDQKMLIVSGQLDSVELSAAVGDVAVLKKPFDGPTLALWVKAILTGAQPG